MLNKPREKKILIVEDHPIVRSSIEVMLENLGCRADFAKDGKEALSFYAQTDYPLILMDIELPDLSGVELIKIIRALEKKYTPLKSTSIVAITSKHDEEDFQKQCLKAGVNAISGKPNPISLKTWIEAYVS
jgi:two-component system, NarL family, capsular synthesis sensor histidine kinase RcsC